MSKSNDQASPCKPETPSGKGAKDENFPVSSILISRANRPHVEAFYDFARAIDDIADNPALLPDDKTARLDGFDQALMGLNNSPDYKKAHNIRSSLIYTGVPIQHCRDLISAFKQDVVKLRYENWDELIDYCDRSAAPVGRYMLDLHGISRELYPASDALCNALQVINHLQDCKDDYLQMNRVYLPQNWMRKVGIDVNELEKDIANKGLRSVINLCLYETSELLALARQLPKPMSNRRLAMETASIIRIAEKLLKELKQRDPLSEKVVLTKPQYLFCCIQGIIRLFFSN